MRMQKRLESLVPTACPPLFLRASLLVTLVAAATTAAEPPEAVCAEEAAMPEIERVVPPVPHPGEWRGKGFGDKRKSSEVEITECGRKIKDLAGVRLRKGVREMVALERDDDDGRYKATFTWYERGMAAVVTWDLEAESESLITGRMTIMGRGDQVEARLLEMEPNPELAACECEAIENRRQTLGSLLADLEQGARRAAEDEALGSWIIDPKACAARATDSDLGLPTQASFEAVARAGWQGAVIHRNRCCAVHRAEGSDASVPTTYSEWIRAASDEHASDEMAALTAEIDALDAWLSNNCS